MNIVKRIGIACLLSTQIQWAGAAGSLDLAAVLFKVMSKGVPAAATAFPGTVTALKQTPAVLKAAEILGKNASDQERLRIAAILQTIVMSERAKSGANSSVLVACRACVRNSFADNAQGRAFDLIRQHNDLILKLAIDPSAVTRVVDANGHPLPTRAEYSRIVDELTTLFAPHLAEAKTAKSATGFLQRFNKSLKENGSIEIDYDGKGNALTATFKYGVAKAKLADVDVGKLFTRLKYLLYGGGLASLGYNATNKERGSVGGTTSPLDNHKGDELWRKLSVADRAQLYQQVETNYLVAKVREQTAAR